MRIRLHSRLIRWTLPAVAVAIAVAVRIALREPLGGLPPFLLFFAAVMASAALGGLGPGIFATALAEVAINFFLIEPYYAFGRPTRGQTIELVIFGVEGLFISFLSGVLHTTVARARASEREARELERRVIEIGDAERRRVGHDLHDGLGQQLLGAAFMAKTLETRLNSASPAHASYAGEIATTINDALSVTRDLARSLTSLTLAQRDLPAALGDLAVTTEKVFGIACAFTRDADIKPPSPDASEHLYRLAQEAVNNAVKHGHASRIEIEWRSRDLHNQVLRVRDNGRGFDVEGAAGGDDETGARGMGLSLMRHRAELAGGYLKITRADDGGTVIACEFRA
jgi:signal transduction histidine kinase